MTSLFRIIYFSLLKHDPWYMYIKACLDILMNVCMFIHVYIRVYMFKYVYKYIQCMFIMPTPSSPVCNAYVCACIIYYACVCRRRWVQQASAGDDGLHGDGAGWVPLCYGPPVLHRQRGYDSAGRDILVPNEPDDAAGRRNMHPAISDRRNGDNLEGVKTKQKETYG